MVPQGAPSVLGAILPYQFHAICRLPKAAGLTPKVCPVRTAFMPPEWSIGSWVLWRICFIIFLHRKLQQNKIISLYVSPISQSPESRDDVNHSASSLCSTLDAGIVTTLYTWYLLYPTGIHCNLEQSSTMFLDDEILCFEKELWNDLSQIRLLKGSAWRRGEVCLWTMQSSYRWGHQDPLCKAQPQMTMDGGMAAVGNSSTPDSGDFCSRYNSVSPPRGDFSFFMYVWPLVRYSVCGSRSYLAVQSIHHYPWVDFAHKPCSRWREMQTWTTQVTIY